MVTRADSFQDVALQKIVREINWLWERNNSMIEYSSAPAWPSGDMRLTGTTRNNRTWGFVEPFTARTSGGVNFLWA